MRPDAKNYAKALAETLKQTQGKDLDQTLTAFVNLLAAEGRLSLYPEIEGHLRQMLLAEEGLTMAELVTAHDIKADKVLQANLEQVVGKKLALSQRIDPNIIGGFVLRVADLLVDASIKKQLATLKAKMSA